MIVVSDTSPLRALDHLGLLSLLPLLYGQVLIPPGVESELAQASPNLLSILATAIPGVQVRPPTDSSLVQLLQRVLDLGESEAIALALQEKADVLLMDEAAGRAEASQRGLHVTGTIGILIRGKDEGHLPAVTPLLDELRDGLGFFISDSLRAKAIALAGE